MLYVGLTGGIGSGKTLAGKILSTLGTPVFNADDETKKCYEHDPALRAKLTALLGNDIYCDGQLQRPVMAAKIFADVSLLTRVEALVHPLIMTRFFRYAAEQQAPCVVLEAAILFESGIGQQMHRTIVIQAPEAIRIQRVMARDNVDEATVRQRMKHQWSDEQRAARADFIVTNDGQQPLLPQLQTINRQLQLATNR
ncbi:MAG: dephospho-CoA kinase [Prevotellaceae bacterium]|jgi:dephospho-CoA kinase|nr:dephospho-CoA kinase [Prevotellaceae bacterium]